jgi:hypothetical protein
MRPSYVGAELHLAECSRNRAEPGDRVRTKGNAGLLTVHEDRFDPQHAPHEAQGSHHKDVLRLRWKRTKSISHLGAHRFDGFGAFYST